MSSHFGVDLDHFPMTYSADTVKLILPTLGLVLVTIINVAITWAKDLNSRSRRLRLLEESTKRIQFWDEWLNKLAAFTTPEKREVARAVFELRRAAEVVTRAFPYAISEGSLTLKEFKRYRANRPAWRRFLLWYYQPTKLGRTLRAYAYIGLVLPTTLGSLPDNFPGTPSWLASRLVAKLPAANLHLTLEPVPVFINIAYSLVVWAVYRRSSVKWESRGLDDSSPTLQ